MQGPITVFEGSSYAGDARILDLQPNEERLLSYAVDLGTEVKPEVAADSGRLTHVKAVKGVLYSTTKLRETKTYTVKNRNPQDRTVLIEHPVRPEFKLVSKDKPAETARDVYRFELKVPAGKTAKETVTEERDLGSTVLLTNSPDEQIRIFLQSPVVSEKVKEGLKKAQELRWEWAKTQREVGEQQRQLQAITEDQARLRANLREVPQSSPLAQALPGQARQAGGRGREVPGRHPEAPGAGARPEEGAGRLPRRLLRRVAPNRSGTLACRG